VGVRDLSAMLVAIAAGAAGGVGSAVTGVPVTPVSVPNAPFSQYSSCVVNPSDQSGARGGRVPFEGEGRGRCEIMH